MKEFPRLVVALLFALAAMVGLSVVMLHSYMPHVTEHAAKAPATRNAAAAAALAAANAAAAASLRDADARQVSAEPTEVLPSSGGSGRAADDGRAAAAAAAVPPPSSLPCGSQWQFWRPTPSDAAFVTPYAAPPTAGVGGRGPYITFEPDEGGWNNVRMAFEVQQSVTLPPSRAK